MPFHRPMDGSDLMFVGIIIRTQKPYDTKCNAYQKKFDKQFNDHA